MNISFRLAVIACILVVAGLAGCAHQAADMRALDPVRLNNAVAADDAGYVRGALQSGVINANQRIAALGYSEGVPLLTIAARYAAIDVIRVLLAAGANVNARTPDGDTPLMLASFFTGENGGNGNSSGEQYERAVRLLLESGAHVENEPNRYTPLAYASYQGHERIVRMLLERGAQVDADADHGEGLTYVNTPLMMAAMQGHEATTLSLLRRGANARIRVRGGHTAAEFADKYNHAAIARMLRCAERLAPGETFAAKCERGR